MANHSRKRQVTTGAGKPESKYIALTYVKILQLNFLLRKRNPLPALEKQTVNSLAGGMFVTQGNNNMT